MRRAAKVDSNQAAIVAALRDVGASVYPTHMVGKGFPDIVVGYRGVNYLMEVKDGSKPPSARGLTHDELGFFQSWTGQKAIVFEIDDALRVIGAMDEEIS